MPVINEAEVPVMLPARAVSVTLPAPALIWPAAMLLPVRLMAPPPELTLLAETLPAPVIVTGPPLACACVMFRLALELPR